MLKSASILFNCCSTVPIYQSLNLKSLFLISFSDPSLHPLFLLNNTAPID